MAMLGGEAMPRVMMQVIRFCINSDDKQLKKLCMLYWEVVPKFQPLTPEQIAANTPRQMLPEMILVCNALMNDLTHPNEYVRGSMLRFLCKINDKEIMSPLIPSIKACLEHRHPYTRKNAYLTVFHVHKLFGDNLMPDATELVAQLLQNETDMACRRNAFLMLLHQHEELAIQYLATNLDDVGQFGDGFALLVLELTRRVCRRDPTQKSRFVRVLFQMLSSNSSAVSYEAAWTLVSLSNAPTAVRAAAVTYTTLLNGPQNDNNVKLIVLERLQALKGKHNKIVQELLMDILRGLSSPNPDIGQKVLEVAMDVVSNRNVKEVVTVLKRHVVKTLHDTAESTSPNPDSDKTAALRNSLIHAIHTCASQYPQVAESVVPTMLECLGTEDSGPKVIMFIRAICETYPNLRPMLLQKLRMSLADVRSNQVLGVALWILGEYSDSVDGINESFDSIMDQAGEPPFLVQSTDENSPPAVASEEPKFITKNVVLSDGTYATQTIYSEPTPAVDSSVPALRRMLVRGDVFLGEVMGSSLTKMVLRGEKVGMDPVSLKKRTVTTLMTLCGVVQMAQRTVTSQRSSASDCQDRLTLCTRALLDPKSKELLTPILLNDGTKRLAEYLQRESEASRKKDDKDKDQTLAMSQADDLIHFRQLRSMAVQGGDVDLDDGSDLARATGSSGAGANTVSSSDALATQLKHSYPLTGFADPVYAEALVTVHDYDIVLEIQVVNRTEQHLHNLTVELSTLGDMKIVERPQAHAVGPLEQITIKASIKVSSTETGHVFGTIVYESGNSSEKNYLHLNDLHMDIMDYIRPASCTDEVFRSMWAEFEWENKVAIATSISNLHDFLQHIVTSTNMQCLTQLSSKTETNFLAANLYARR